MTKSSSVQSLDRAFGLLELLCRSRGGMSIAALCAETGLHKSTVHRLLGAMVVHGFVVQDSATSTYHAGMKLCELSSHITENLDIVERARRAMSRLSRDTGETVHLVVREENEIVYIHKVDSVHSAIRMFSRIGMRRPLYCTGVGKAILATLPDDEVQAVWQSSDVQAYTTHTITSKRAFEREIARIRHTGYALDNEENELDVRCVAAAIPDYTGRATFAMSISAPLTRMSNSRVSELSVQLLAACREISATLGG